MVGKDIELFFLFTLQHWARGWEGCSLIVVGIWGEGGKLDVRRACWSSWRTISDKVDIK